jgi:homoserine O-acetyltransferase
MDEFLQSTDGQRSANQLTHLQLAHFKDPLMLERGGSLPEFRVAYETYGELNEDHSNAVLICHAISGDSHVASHGPDDDPGWWEELVGSGRAIDTDKLFVICSNVLGGCRGTTGPGDYPPDSRRPYGADFPAITLGDMVDAQVRLIDSLGIERLAAVMGGSLGGHQALVWATRYPNRVATAAVIASSARLTSQALAFDVVARNAIRTDPAYAEGQYYKQEGKPEKGLAIARMLGHITYLSQQSMAQKFDVDRHEPREIESDFERQFSVGSYLALQGHRFVTRFDANSYMTISMAMDLMDLGRTHEARVESLRSSTCRWMVVSFSSDWLFPPSQSRDLVSALTSLGKSVSYCEVESDGGHDGFLLSREIATFGPLLAARVGQREPLPTEPRLEDDRILDLLPAGTSVLDLGCGDGHLLARLKARGHERLCGVEIETRRIVQTAQHDVEVIDCDLNLGLPEFDDGQFDYVVISSTLQVVPNVRTLLEDSLRVGRRVLLVFANFAYAPMRRMLAEEGLSPKTPGPYGHEWYDTPNNRFPSILDVRQLCEEMGLSVEEEQYYAEGHPLPKDQDRDPNRDAETALFVLGRP